MRRHPNRRRLEAWLEGTPDEAVDEHLDTCERCADTIEEIAGAEDPIQSALRTVLAVPTDLRLRVEAGISARLQNRSDLEILGEMFGVGLSTARMMIDTGGASVARDRARSQRAEEDR